MRSAARTGITSRGKQLQAGRPAPASEGEAERRGSRWAPLRPTQAERRRREKRGGGREATGQRGLGQRSAPAAQEGRRRGGPRRDGLQERHRRAGGRRPRGPRHDLHLPPARSGRGLGCWERRRTQAVPPPDAAARGWGGGGQARPNPAQPAHGPAPAPPLVQLRPHGRLRPQRDARRPIRRLFSADPKQGHGGSSIGWELSHAFGRPLACAACNPVPSAL